MSITQVDFYILKETGQKAWLFVCQFVEKLWLANHQAYIHMLNQTEANRLDQLLWTYQESSFIPHLLLSETKEADTPIMIGYEDAKIPDTDIIINIGTNIPIKKSLQTLVEIVFNEPDLQQTARERYKQYREQGFKLNTIK